MPEVNIDYIVIEFKKLFSKLPFNDFFALNTNFIAMNSIGITFFCKLSHNSKFLKK
jgi:hypothetical protein